MKGYLWAALYASDSNADWATPSFHCDTGNCTWYGYQSLGVCSRCADISSQLQKSCTPAPADLTNTTTGCDILLPNGFGLGGPTRNRTNLMAMSTDFGPLVYGNYSNPLAVIQAIGAYDDTRFVNSSSQVNASECVLFPCVILYNTAVSYNSPTAASVGQNSVEFFEVAERIYDEFTLTPDGPTITTPANPKINNSLIVVPENPEINNPTTYKMSQPAYLALKNYLTSLFNGYAVTDGQNVTFHADNKTRAVVTNNADAMESVFQPVGGAYCPDIFGTMTNDPAICSLHSASIAMTNVIRGQAPGQFNFSIYQATGITWYPQPMVIVGWLWIIPVLFLWLLSVVLLAGTVWKTKKVGVHKAMGLNPLALLFLGVEEDEEEKARGHYWHSNDEVKKKAERMTVRLSLVGKKAALVQKAHDHDERREE
jgi:hypothetical protein